MQKVHFLKAIVTGLIANLDPLKMQEWEIHLRLHENTLFYSFQEKYKDGLSPNSHITIEIKTFVVFCKRTPGKMHRA